MACEVVQLPNGVRAIVCGARRRRRCSHCRELTAAPRLCDWKTGPSTTCSAVVCARCATSPAPEKDLCPRHAAAWRNHRANKGNNP